MKNFFNEFKKFISRGNVIDLAVGVIIGSAFTAFVVFCMVFFLPCPFSFRISCFFIDSPSSCQDRKMRL